MAASLAARTLARPSFEDAFAAPSFLRAMLAFESSLARAQAEDHAAGIAEHERALGGWQAELALVPEIAGTLGTALDFIDTVGASLVVDAARMRSNLAAYGEGSAGPGMERFADEILAGLAGYLA